MSSNGQQPPSELSPEEQYQLAREYLHGTMRALSSQGLSGEIIDKALHDAQAMETTQDFHELSVALYDSKRVAARPYWGMKLHHKQLAEPHVLIGPKRIPAIDAPAPEIGAWCMLYGLMTSPLLRAALLLNGFRPEFVEVAGKGKPSPIILKA